MSRITFTVSPFQDSGILFVVHYHICVWALTFAKGNTDSPGTWGEQGWQRDEDSVM